jgi:SAM-dependent methyltransferase
MAGLRRQRLEQFTQWVAQHCQGDEKGQAQIFLDRLFQGFGQPGCLDIGGTPEFRIRKAKEDGGGTAFADYVWKPVVLIEMKKRGEDLSRHYRQAFDYWTRLVPGRPRYVVLCNFDEFWVYDFETQMDAPVDKLAVAELPARPGPLAFLFPKPEKPVFGNDHEEVTRTAADRLATCFNKLVTRGIERALAQRFILQSLVALFAEDIGLLDQYLFTRLLEECDEPRKSYDLLGQLFVEMNTPGITAGGRFKGVDYFNGGLFAVPARIELYPDEIAQLRKAAESNWANVRPEIFGTLFEHSVDQAERRAYGQHFTTAVDIMKIVGPTIVEPWRKLIEDADSTKRLLELRKRLTEFHVLDPACGSGNFLYIAYREMKRLEARIFERIDELAGPKAERQKLIGFVTANQFYGIDINPLGIELAKVTMMIARKLAIDELKMDERALPLDNLEKNFVVGDALIQSVSANLDGDRQNWRIPTLFGDAPVRTKWPPAHAIIGNPPFLDARKMNIEHGEQYVHALEAAYPQISRRADFCVYWFRKAHDQLPDCTPDDPSGGRAGLVGTQNVRNNEAREGGLDHVVASGTIVEAVDNQPWSGEANVHVSIANWVKHPKGNEKRTEREQARIRAQLLIPDEKKLWFKIDSPPGRKKIRKAGTGPASKEYELAFRSCAHINSALSDQVDVSLARVLSICRDPKKCFEGQQPGHTGFRITKSEFGGLKKLGSTAGVVFPYLNATSLVTSGYATNPEYIIDFAERDLLAASEFPKALDIVRERVLPKWRQNANKEQRNTQRAAGEHQRRLESWWQLKRRRGELIAQIDRLPRYVACSRVTKRPIFDFINSHIHPDSSLTAFTFDDDYSFGILQSNVHWQWFVAKCSKLKSDFRYTPESVFDTFPWPQSPTAKQIDAVAKAAREVRRVRAEALTKIKGGLRAVYRTLELPGKNPLKDAHAELDAAVLDAYGFSAKADLLQQLLDLNLEVARRIDEGQPVTAPGIPPGYPQPERLVSEDCIRP